MGAKMQSRFRKHQVFAGVIFALVFVLLGMSDPARGDEDSARVYLNKARDLIKNKEYQSALECFQKAAQEAPDFVDLYFERGVMYWNLREATEAMNDFNKASDLLKAKTELPKQLQLIQGKIASYQTEYEKIRKELDDINRKYLGKFLELADKYQDSGEDYLLQLLKHLSKMEPGNKEIEERTAKLNSKSMQMEKGVMESLFNGKDLIGWELFENNVFMAEAGQIRGKSPDGAYITVSNNVNPEGNYTLSIDVQLAEQTGKDHLFGLAFAFKKINEMYYYGFYNNRLVFKRYTRGAGEDKPIKDLPLPARIDPAKWNTLMIKTKDNSAGCYLNNELQFEVIMPDENPPRFKGLPGVLIQSCNANFKDILYLSD
jgi:hypothetical protein